jgi:small subunit ribosomal protein S8
MAELRGRDTVTVRPASKVLKQVLLLLQRQGYVGDFEFIDDGKSGEFTVKLVGKINDCGVVKPRFSVKKTDWEKFEQRYLPARDIGLLVVSTSAGIMTHSEAKEKGLGGRMMSFVY